MPLTETREIGVSSPLGPDKLLFGEMTAREELGRPFQYDLVLLSKDENIAGDDLLGKEMSVAARAADGDDRFFSGYVTAFSFAGIHIAGKQEEMAKYHVTLRPWLAFLELSSDYRIYQDKKVDAIIKEVFDRYNVARYEVKLTETYEKRPYTVQFGETDFQFVSRLMEEEGIYYYFKHAENQHTLVLADSYSSHGAAPGYGEVVYEQMEDATEREGFRSWRMTQQVRSTGFNVDSFDFTNPKKNLQGKSKTSHSHSGPTELEHNAFPGTYTESGHASRLARIRREESQALAKVAVGGGDVRGLRPGFLFKLQNHPRRAENQEYLVIGGEFKLEMDGYRTGGGGDGLMFDATLRAIASRHPFRTASTTPRPVAAGPQTAIVVGKQGEEIWTEEHGRVRVKFHWDRHGKDDETASCWVRVSQAWAGKGFGAASIPRIGQEVVIEYIDGDPDRPIITGRVYNGDNKYPESLPDNATMTAFRSRSSKGGGPGTYNELTFEDKKDSELIRLQAEKDYKGTIKNDRKVTVGLEKKDNGDDTLEIHRHRTTTLNTGDDTLDIKKGKRTVTIEGDHTETVNQGKHDLTLKQGDQTITLKSGKRTITLDMGNEEHVLKMGNFTTNAKMGSITLEAMQGITLKVGQTTVKLDMTGVTIKGGMVKIEGTMLTEVKGMMTKVQGSAMFQAQGGVMMIG